MAICSVLLACSPQIANFDQTIAENKANEFANGEITLECKTFSCAGYIGSVRKSFIEYDLEERWSKLAKEVIRSGWDEDLSYFYLGKSAEHLNMHDAALIYYKKALNNVQKCKGAILDYCGGYSFPNDIQERISKLKIENP